MADFSRFFDDNEFFKILFRGVVGYLNHAVKLNGKDIPHFILHTGSEYLYYDALDYDFKNIHSSESHIYLNVPRCLIDFQDISTDMSQLTNPHVRAQYEKIDSEGQLRTYSAECRRMPIRVQVSMTYFIDSFTDSLKLTQILIERMAFDKVMYINYLGREIDVSMRFPDTIIDEHMNVISFDTGDKNRTLKLSLQIDTNLPIYNRVTQVDTGNVISAYNKLDYSIVNDPKHIGWKQLLGPSKNAVGLSKVAPYNVFKDIHNPDALYATIWTIDNFRVIDQNGNGLGELDSKMNGVLNNGLVVRDGMVYQVQNVARGYLYGSNIMIFANSEHMYVSGILSEIRVGDDKMNNMLKP